MKLTGRIIILIVLFWFSVGKLLAQTARAVKFDQLKTRIYAKNDTTYIVNFWATWCTPCQDELPYFERLNTELKGKPVKVLLVSLDFKSKLNNQVNPFLKRNKIASEVLLLDEKDQQAYIDKIDKSWSGALPATLIVNNSRNKSKFYEKEFTYFELLNACKLIN